MALIWYEHFDLYGTVWNNLLARGYSGTNSNAGAAWATTTARTGALAILVDPPGAGSLFLRRTFPFTRNVVGQGVGMRVNSLSNQPSLLSQTGIRFGAGATVGQVQIILTNALSFEVYIGSTLIGTIANAFVLQSFFWIEAKVVAGTGNGSLEVRINGNQVFFNGTLTIAPINSVTIGKPGEVGGLTAEAIFDDWVVWDDTGVSANDFMGDTFVIVAPPNADGTPNDWTPSTGSDRFAMVNATTPNDATFVSASNTGQAQEFGHAAVNLPVGAVAAIAAQTRAFKSDAGAADYRLGIASGSAKGMSNDIALATGVVAHAHIQNVDPATGLPWTQAGAQAAQVRLERA